MAQARSSLQSLLESFFGEDEAHVYFQPPNNIDLQYPCIIYVRDGSDSKFADNVKYAHYKRYQVTVVDRDPDSELPDKVEELRLSEFDRYFAADNLNHHVFTLYF
jgi:hypothetical protein